MKRLNTNEYYKVKKTLQNVNINTLFAKSVLNQHMPGLVYVDNDDEPSVFYIYHTCGMSLLFGNINNVKFNLELFDYLTNKDKSRNKYEWLQVYPNNWDNVIKKIFGSELLLKDKAYSAFLNNNMPCYKAFEHTRVNFVFENQKYKNARHKLNTTEYQIVPITKEMYLSMEGMIVPKYFWRNEEQFYKNGTGYNIIIDGEIVSTAFSAFRHENQLEIGVETSEKYRGKGLATMVCSALMDYCLHNDLEPVWSCRLENAGSYSLAQKLGFIPSITIPYYQFI